MKKLLYIIIGLIVLYFILCLFGPANVKVERSTTINAPADMIKTKLLDFKMFHDTWSPWTEKDPGMKVSYAGEMGQPGSSMSWESTKKEVGKGTMTYIATSGDSVIEKLHFDDMGDAKVYFMVTPEGTGNKITWGMTNHIGFMGRAFMLFMNIDKMVGGDFEKGLAKLKPALESAAAAPTAVHYDIKEESWEERVYIGKKENVAFDKLSPFFAENLPKIYEYISKNKLETASSPSGIFFTFDEAKQHTDCAAVIGVKGNKEAKGWEKFVVPASKVLMVAYYGPYEKTMAAHDAINNYMKEKGLSQSMVIEEYVTDPMTEKDPNKWLTNIYYVLK